MHYHFLPSLLTPLTLSIISLICARSHHQASEQDDTFVLPPFLGYLMLGIGLFLCAVPFVLPGAAGDMSQWRFFLIFAPAWGGVFLAALYFFRYRVVVTDTTLTVVGVRRHVVSFEDVVDYDVIVGRGSELVVYLRDGKKLILSGLLPDFDELVGLVNSHRAIPPPGQMDTPEKIRDRFLRARDARRANWLAIGGILICVGVAYLVTWFFG
jgi:hypothetical protein